MKEQFMRLALGQALKSAKHDEVPIGAVIVLNGKVIAKGRNRVEKTQVATRHAEIVAIEKACKKLKSWRLDGAEIYITLEPCSMCAGAIDNARIKKVYFGAYEHKSGCAISKYPVLSDNGLNHTVEYEGGVLLEECESLLKNYFKAKRKRKSLDLNIKM
jgi:tRNA(adenine34) deaminase